MATVVERLAALAKNPKARAAIERAREQAAKPKNRARIEDLRSRWVRRGPNGKG
jgi:hypothetical protein